jgi:PTH1 family peptidyl-tRNA hydrolase
VSESFPSERRKLLIGLGNPGRAYAATRHNVGFRVLEVLRRRWGLGDGQESFAGLVWTARRPGPVEGSGSVVLLAPMTYMNESGRSVRQLMDFYKAEPADLLVVLDDLALPLGLLRARPTGSAGGHNGLADVIRVCGTPDVPRLRVGIGDAPPAMDPRDYVLGKFRPDEVETIGAAIEVAADAAEVWIASGIQKVMERYNNR